MGRDGQLGESGSVYRWKPLNVIKGGRLYKMRR